MKMATDGDASGAPGSQADESMVEPMIVRVIELAGHHKQDNKELLVYFADDLKEIALTVMSADGEKPGNPMLSLARQCYLQATTHEGILHCDRYFSDLPQGHDLSSRTDCKSQCKTTIEQRWILLWSEALHNCPGPALFEPHLSPLFSSFDFGLDKIPRYLFRTYDRKSFGRSDEDVMASPASKDGLLNSKLDIFSLNKDLAMSIVDRHMNPWFVKDYWRQPPDNFMSWTSSLLYAVQYALYRRYHHGCTSEEIKICVIDTTAFQKGQFIHAKRLLKAYYDRVKRVDMRQSFSTRLLVYIYQNGEFLSQGALSHQSKSCVMSLAGLERSGLYSLYPELAIVEGQSKWAVTTAHLRKLWTEQYISTYEELETALLLARACFVGFDVLDLAIMVLSFRRRKLKQVTCGEKLLLLYTHMQFLMINLQRGVRNLLRGLRETYLTGAVSHRKFGNTWLPWTYSSLCHRYPMSQQ